MYQIEIDEYELVSNTLFRVTKFIRINLGSMLTDHAVEVASTTKKVNYKEPGQSGKIHHRLDDSPQQLFKETHDPGSAFGRDLVNCVQPVLDVAHMV